MDCKIFKDRIHAGILLLDKIKDIIDDNTIFATVPNGGVLVAKQIIGSFKKPLYLILSKKIPLKNIPYVGLGAVTINNINYNNERIEYLNLKDEMLKTYSQVATHDLREKQKILSNFIAKPEDLEGKKVILIDDGVASGYTMLSAIKDLNQKKPQSIIVATPVMAAEAKEKLEKVVDKIFCCYLSNEKRFIVDEYYENFESISNVETLRLLSEAV